MSIKAIETRYKGYRFRSRLEARWAVVFDALGLRWEYEPQGFSTPWGPYLPDFCLHGAYGPVWFEVKGVKPTDLEAKKLGFVVMESKGSIDQSHMYGFIAEGIDGGASLWEVDQSGQVVDRYPMEASEPAACLMPIGFNLQGLWNANHPIDGAYLKGFESAVVKARSARFEHGEVPA